MHTPRPTAHVSLVLHNGGAFYSKNGQLTPVGPFAGDLEGLVGPSPEAARLAHRATNQLKVGVPLYVVGLASIVVSLAAVHGDARWPLIGTAVAVTGTGLSFMGAGFTNAVDAVNVYNDAVDERP